MKYKKYKQKPKIQSQESQEKYNPNKGIEPNVNFLTEPKHIFNTSTKSTDDVKDI